MKNSVKKAQKVKVVKSCEVDVCDGVLSVLCPPAGTIRLIVKLARKAKKVKNANEHDQEIDDLIEENKAAKSDGRAEVSEMVEKMKEIATKEKDSES